MTDSAAPRLATTDDDRWSLQNAEDRLARGDGIYWLPDRWTREHLEEHVPEGGHVKLLFVIQNPTDLAKPVVERMWVTFCGRDGAFYHGHLANEPRTPGTARQGMPVWFLPEHVIDHAGPEGENQASESADAVRCSRHGLSHQCFVCEHLTPDSDGRGFNTADPDSLRPDAWCDRCHEELTRAGSWEAATAEPKIHLVCGGCYDALRRRHSRRR
jgi:hypothetical protein